MTLASKNIESSLQSRLVGTLMAAGLVAAVAQLVACSSSGGHSEENAVTHEISQSDRATLEGTEPIGADSAVVWVNGLGCPQCASNIDLQLARLPGVDEVRVDLGQGLVEVTFRGDRRPTPKRLASAVVDAGFTPVRFEAQP